MRRSFSLFLACMMGIAILVGCFARAEPTNGVEHVTHKYGIPPERVIALANELGVNPDDIPLPESYENDRPFPIDFFHAEIKAFEEKEERPATRADVEQIIRGYVAMCEGFPHSTGYYFYSTKVVRRWREREVTVHIVVEYNEDPNKRGEHKAFIYNRIYNVVLKNEMSPFFDALENYGDSQCIKEYLEAEGIITPYVEPTEAP